MEQTTDSLLKFSYENAKLKGIHTFALVAGDTCPGADKCMARVRIVNEKRAVIRGEDAEFTCYWASLEAIFPSLHRRNLHNLNLLKLCKTMKEMAILINKSLPYGAKIVRIHPGGDFFSEAYFVAWINVAINNPSVVFYAYTKSIHFWRRHMKQIPSNFKLIASVGGKYDRLITKSMKRAYVVFSPEEADKLGLPIDTDDSHAYSGDNSFCLLLHGKQKAGTKAAEALRTLVRNGMGTYGKGHRPVVESKQPFKFVVA